MVALAKQEHENKECPIPGAIKHMIQEEDGNEEKVLLAIHLHKRWDI